MSFFPNSMSDHELPNRTVCHYVSTTHIFEYIYANMLCVHSSFNICDLIGHPVERRIADNVYATVLLAWRLPTQTAKLIALMYYVRIVKELNSVPT